MLEIINEIHIDLLSIVIKELFDKNKFEEFKENNPDLVSFLYLIKTVKDMRNFDDIFFHSWTEILNQLPNLSLKVKAKNNFRLFLLLT